MSTQLEYRLGAITSHENKPDHEQRRTSSHEQQNQNTNNQHKSGHIYYCKNPPFENPPFVLGGQNKPPRSFKTNLGLGQGQTCDKTSSANHSECNLLALTACIVRVQDKQLFANTSVRVQWYIQDRHFRLISTYPTTQKDLRGNEVQVQVLALPLCRNASGIFVV